MSDQHEVRYNVAEFTPERPVVEAVLGHGRYFVEHWAPDTVYLELGGDEMVITVEAGRLVFYRRCESEPTVTTLGVRRVRGVLQS